MCDLSHVQYKQRWKPADGRLFGMYYGNTEVIDCIKVT